MKFSFATFKARFQPVERLSSAPKNGTYKDYLYRVTIPEEFEAIRNNTSSKNVWSILRGKNNSLLATPGKSVHFGPIGYFITKEPYSQHQLENLKIIISEGYEDIRKSDITYLQILKFRIMNETEIDLKEDVYDRVLNWLSERVLEEKY